MADVAVRVELEDDRAYLPGERIDGFVVVTAADVIDCQPLCVRLTRASSAADFTKIEVARQELHRGELTAGEHRYRFTLEVPSGRLPMELPWHVEAVVGLDWRSDPAHARAVSLQHPGALPPGPTFSNQLSPWWWLTGFVALAGVRGGFWFAWSNGFAVRENEQVFWALVVAVVSCGVAGWVGRRLWSRFVWGRVELTMHGTPRAGKPLTCTLRVGRAVTLKYAVVRLEGTSWSRTGANKNSTHSTSPAGMAVTQAGDGARLEAGGTLEVTLGVPRDARASYVSALQGVRWELSAVLHAPGRLPCELKHEVAVVGR